jgi:wee1-like protein kinase
MCVDPFERKKRRVGSSSEISRFRSDFTDVELIGKGSFSDVFRAKSRIDNQIYAIKRIKKQCTTDGERRACQKEPTILSLLSHTSDKNPELACHIIRYYASWFEEGRLFIQTEYCESTVPDLITDAGGSLDEQAILMMLRDISRGLKFLHQMNLVHLDIKPANIFQSGRIFKIGDMGLVSPSVEKSPEITSGDARYLPREILLNNFQHLDKADIFSLGASVLECMLGERLEPEGEEWHKLRDGDLPVDELIGYSEGLIHLVSRMMAPDPESRPCCDDILQVVGEASLPDTCEENAMPLRVIHEPNRPETVDDISPTSIGTSAGGKDTVKSSPGKAIMRSLKHTRQKLRKLFTAT